MSADEDIFIPSSQNIGAVVKAARERIRRAQKRMVKLQPDKELPSVDGPPYRGEAPPRPTERRSAVAWKNDEYRLVLTVGEEAIMEKAERDAMGDLSWRELLYHRTEDQHDFYEALRNLAFDLLDKEVPPPDIPNPASFPG